MASNSRSSTSDSSTHSSTFLAESGPCQFPRLRTGVSGPRRPVSIRVSLEHLQKLQQLLASDEAALWNLLRTAWGILLRCYTGRDDVYFGYHESDLGALVSGGPTGSDIHLRTSVVRFLLDDTISLAKILEKSKGKSFSASLNALETSERQLFDTAVLLRSFPNKAVSNVTRHLPLNVLPEEYKIRLLIKSLNGSLSVFMEWWSSHLSMAQASAISSTLDRIISSILTVPDTILGELDHFSKRNMQQVLSWNNSALNKVERCIHDVIDDQILLRPDAEAVCAWDGTFSYRELGQSSDYLAEILVKLGVGPEVCVPLCFDKSKWTIVAMLGVMKAGGAFVPLDPTHPLPRLQTLARSVNANVLLCSRRHAELLATVSDTVLPVDENELVEPHAGNIERVNRAVSSNAAYLIFTSGSTGEPKGTVIEHSAYCSSAKAHTPRVHMNEDSRVLQFAAHTFDSSLIESLTPLMCGACICIPSEDARLNDIVGAINEMHVNHAIFTPSFVGFVNPTAVPELRTLVLAGEAMSPSHVATWSDINLVNGYGPTESSVSAVINSHVTAETDCKDIGFPVGVHCWLVDPSNHNHLVPVGCIGELLLEGPTLARCYLNNLDKTNESFIFDPAWSLKGDYSTLGRRFYKTGDLARYNSEHGSLSFVGRKDTQVKFHGQRIEIGEIEYHLSADPYTKHSLVLLPKSGHCERRLVAVISLSDSLACDAARSGAVMQIVQGSQKHSHTEDIRRRMSARLPAYMVPSTWLCVESIPMLTSGKLDRKTVARWVESMTLDDYLHVTQQPSSEEGHSAPATEVENQLISIWSRTLNIPLNQVSLDRSFLSLGGDSITAMTCMSQAKKSGLGLTVQDILRCKSIKQLANCVHTVENQIVYQENLNKPFALSPIQQLHFEVRTDRQGHFNQSFLLRLTRMIHKTDLVKAIETLIDRHSMLRARFSQGGPNGAWHQYITQDIPGSYRFRTHKVYSREQAEPAISSSQGCLNAQHGPVFAVDLFEINGQEQLVFLVGHHLVIDLVSWRIILEDLEETLEDPGTTATMQRSLPFQTWCRLQTEHCQGLSAGEVLPVDNVPVADLEYWGMENKPNNYGDVACEGFEIDSTTTSLLLTDCHKALKTETVDILLSTLLHSFSQIFANRGVPAVYSEGHGREPPSPDIDISRTVGWFTVVYPVYVPVTALEEVVETVKRIKDLRRRVPANGRPYFASRFLSTHGRNQFKHHSPMEVTFNFLGQYQQLEREGTLLQPMETMAGEAHAGGTAADFAHTTPRFGLFEISAVVVRGKIRFSFTFNRYMKRQQEIRRWIAQCRQTLSEVSRQLVNMNPQPTLSDFPLLSLTYDNLKSMQTEKLRRVGIYSMDAVEDIYPCSPIQQGLLLSRNKDASYYAVHGTYEVKLRHQEQVDPQRLADAWQQVIAHHAALRTIFVESLSSEGLYDQVVIRVGTTAAIHISCDGEEDVLDALNKQVPMSYEDGKISHRFTICQCASGRVFCRVEMSHVIMDGASMSIIFQDLGLAYARRLQGLPKPLYSNFIAYLKNQPPDSGVEFWKSYLSELEPCHFPILNDGISTAKKLHSVKIDFGELPQLQGFCDNSGFTLANAFHTAWGLTLRCYTGSEDICFGYLTSGRDAPVLGVEAAIGPFINMLVCRANMLGSISLDQVLGQVQKDYMDGLPYKHTSLAEVQHALRLSGVALFNTCLSYRKLPSTSITDQTLIAFSEHAPIHDPTEYPVSINIEISEKGAAIDLDYWTDSLSDGQAANVASTFTQSLRNIIYDTKLPISELEQAGNDAKEQIWAWNSHIPNVVNECVHMVVEKQTKLRPHAQAICAWDGKFTYCELDKLSKRLAHYLVNLGIGAETLVPICFDKSAWTIISMLAVLKAGGGCVPLDAKHPKNALETRVVATEAHVVLASPQRAHIFEDMVPYVVAVGPALLEQLSEIDTPAGTSVQPTNTSFIIFTSGSSGRPKGVVLEHSAIVTSAEAHGSALGVGPQTRFLQFAAYTFDNSLEEMFTTLMRGGCVCVPSENDRLNDLAKAINELDANFMDLTPTVAAFLQPSDVPKIKALAVGGETLTKKVVEIWGKAIPVHNQYGPSECSINSTHNGGSGSSEDVSNIGRSVGSVSWIVDSRDHNKLVPIGCAGELLIEGPILARGYLNDEEKTSKSFIEGPAWVSRDPYGTDRGRRRMYKTGDLVRYNSDGSLSYLGRKDTQVKLNGQRIELGEIEHHIKTNLPDDAQSTVELVTAGGAQSTKALAAFLHIPTNDLVSAVRNEEDFILPISPSFREIVQALEAAVMNLIPAYMVPTIYIPVSRMPLTSSGKLDRRILRTMAQRLSGDLVAAYRLGGKSGRMPSTRGEKELQHLWASVLAANTDSISADDNFFRRGGDSIGAMRLVAAARAKGILLTVANIFQAPKLSDMAHRAEILTEPSTKDLVQAPVQPFSLLRKEVPIRDLKEEVASICKIDFNSVEDIYPCTTVQEGLIALSSKQPGAYVAMSTYRLPTNINLPRFRKAWQKVADMEVVLRTRIVFTRSLGFLQVVVRERISWNSVPDIQSILATDRHLPPHDGGILSRYTIAGENTQAPYFIWTAHHALYDGWSLPILLSRVETHYRNAEVSNSDPPQYAKFVEYVSGIDSIESDRFWKARLSGPTVPQLPQLPHPGYEVQATSQVSHTAHISKPPNIDLTTATLVRAAWALVVSIYTSSGAVVFGEILTGRDVPVPGIEDIIGPTLATVPTSLHIDRDVSIEEFLQDIQKQLSTTIPYQFTGLQRIRRLSPETAVACDFQNLLAISSADPNPIDSFWEMTGSGTSGTNFYTYPLNVSCVVGDGRIDIEAHYDQVVIPTWQVTRMLYQLETVLNRLISKDGMHEKLGYMDVLSTQDQATIYHWNRDPIVFVDKCIHQVFREQVSLQPNLVAVCSWDISFTYAELDQLSTSLAHHLIDLDVASQELIPLCFEKSAFTIVAMLAVLKTGSAFVPLDPAHPVGRLQEIVSDMKAETILCSPRYQVLCESVAAQTFTVDLDTLKQLPSCYGALPSCASSAAAYAIFTSGTTGKPKGTLVGHSAFCSGAAAHAPAMLMTPPFRILQFASYTFDASLVEILTSLMVGGTVCVPSEFDRMNNVAAVVESMNVDIALWTPSFAQLVKPDDVPSLHTLILAGEAMSKSHVSTWAGKVNLVNGYGPSECSVAATVNSNMTMTTNPSNMGVRLDRCWVVDPQNHHRLAPIGSVGELLVEGPTLAKGYLNNVAKTEEVFIENPMWAKKGFNYPDLSPNRRMYKTGDLVRFCSDTTGEMIYLGRKDTQAKVNGQRLELDEVEHHLNAEDAVQHVLVCLPKSGPCANRLVAVLSLQELPWANVVTRDPQIVVSPVAFSIVAKVQARLRSHLPAYMIPSKWVILQKLPLLASGKLDRKYIADYVENMSDEVHDKISVTEATERNSNDSQISGVDRQLQLIWGHVLNLTPERVGFNQSFLHLGGDSISAMQVMARCRSEGIGVTVQDIIRSRSIMDLASRVSLPKQAAYEGEDAHEFDLSPIQQLYFTCVGSHVSQFNQSVLLRFRHRANSEDVSRNIKALVNTHSMLRARFRKDGTGNWRQRITTDIPGSYRFRTHNIMNAARIKTRIEDSQKSLDVQKGPILAIDLFNVGENDVQLFIAAHHLVIDVFSWHIILQDFEDLFTVGRINSQNSLSFQSWCRLQSANAQQQNGKLVLPHHDASAADLDYWGMADKPNLYGDVVSEEIEFDSKTTDLLLGSCHESLHTDTLDVLLAVLLQAYRNVFSDRQITPTIYNEGHGREPWEANLDLSRTVGWFTTLCPVHLPSESSNNDLINAIRWVKDYRRRLPGKGRAYFAYRLLTSQGRDEYGSHWPMEMAFNYLGQMQQLERKDTILQAVDGGQSVNTLSDISGDVPRFALIEVSAIVTNGKMKLSFSYNKLMKHQSTIKKWIAECQYLLHEAPERLMSQKIERTLSDFPLSPLAYRSAEKLARRAQEIGLSSLEEIEDFYPCSPMQRGLLLSQMKDPKRYAYRSVFEVRSARGKCQVDLDMLSRAWQKVVQRHAALRTVFVESVSQDDLMDQVVIKQMDGRTKTLDCQDEEVAGAFSALQPLDYSEKKPPHRLALCKTTTGRVFCSLEISHVISDGSSMPILLRDLANSYVGATAVDDTVPLYSDYIAYIQQQPRDESIYYWKEFLTDVEPCLFPTLSDGEADSIGTLSSHIIKLELMAELQAFCTEVGVTMSNVLQLVWALVLRCYTGSDDVCFGYLASGRDMPVKNIEQAVGTFINMLVCRINLPDDLELGEALSKIQRDFANSMAHQSCSLAEVQHELGLSGISLFNTAFTYQKRAGTGEQDQSALLYDVVEAHDPSEYGIAINIEATDISMEAHFTYWSNILSDAQARNVATTFEQVLRDLIRSQHEDRTVGDLEFAGEDGRQQICTWNSNMPRKVEKCIHEIIEQQALLRPLSTPAICGWDANFTYTELETATTCLARRLVRLGTGPEVYVPLCFEKSAWTIVAQLAILKAGGAFVSLDPSFPESRLQHLINDVGASLVLCSSKYKDKASKVSKIVFVVDRNAINQLSNLPATPPSPGAFAKPSNPAYVIFTSGTTGLPKGTVVEHGAFCTGAVAHSEAMFMRPNSRVFQFASYTFDASMMEIFSTLLTGGCVCIPSDQDRINDIAGAIRKMSINWALLTPSVAGTLKPENVPSLKVLVTGGEAMSAGHINKWGKRCTLVNAYGPTECSVIATTSTKVDENGRELNSDRFNIGTAVGGRAWIVDHRNYNRLVPLGAVGELVIEGRLVARGYLNNEKKTSEVFVEHPEWTRHPGFSKAFYYHERMYRTGDLVRYNSDGSICYISRKDTQIKLNGQRIELGEIEYQCRQYLPDQAQAAVDLVIPTSRVATKALAVFFSLSTNDYEGQLASSEDELLLPMDDTIRLTAQTLESSLASVLPTYMVPQLFVPVSKMPWMSSGKLDRRKLRQLVEKLSKEATSDYRLSASVSKRNPATEMERKLQGLWEKIMKLSPGSIGADDNFFRLGGDSLAAMSLVGAARSQNISLTVANIFQKPKLSDLAKTCENLKEDFQPELKPFALLRSPQNLPRIMQEVGDQCQVREDLIQDIYPCSSLQSGLITLTTKQPGAYIAQNAFRLSQDVDINRFKWAWQKVIDDTDMLRTRIVHTTTSGFLQVVIKEERINWHTAGDLQDASEEISELPVHNGGPLTRYTVVGGNSSANRYFVWAIHHALYDGWSLPLILKHVEEVYLKGGTSRTQPPYAKFIEYLQKTDLKSSENFWKSHLAGVSLTHFPQTPHSAAEKSPSFQTATHSVNIARKEVDSNITVPTIIRAAWAMLLAAYTGDDDVVFGETLIGRNINVPDITEIVGPTFTTIPTRIRLNRNTTVSQFIREVHEMSTNIIPHQHLGLQHIKRLGSDSTMACEFQNLLSIQTAEEKSQEGLWDFQSSGSAENFFTHPLVTECKVSNAGIEIVIYHNEHILSAWQVERLLHQFEAVLKQLGTASKNKTTKLGDLDIFSLEDETIVARWNHRTPHAIDNCIHDLFIEKALARPDSQAICAWDGNMTYQELDDYASRLALHLVTLGVGAETLVPICLDRSAWTIVAILAILIAGGAFVPLDPSHPLSRHKEILKETDAGLILCQPEYSSRFLGVVNEQVLIDKDVIHTLPRLSHLGELSYRSCSSDTAYVIFTSGSTGRAKGVVIEHRAFCSSSAAFAKAMLMNADCRIFHFASLTFDAAVMEILTTLTLGACICIPSPEERLKDIAGAMCNMAVNWSLLTPSVASLIEPSSVPPLRTLVCGGEALLKETVEKWADQVSLMNAYGPAEASVIVAVNSRLSVDRHPSIIGQGTAAVSTWIVDINDHNKLAPVGAVGELVVGGPAIARGYLKNPKKTAESFIENPTWAARFAARTQRIYKTGDLVRYGSNGALEFIGRKDNQVKLNGQRMELGEIENRLDGDPRIRHALVVMPKSGPCKKRLVAVLSLNSLTLREMSLLPDTCELVKGREQLQKARKESSEIRSRLSDLLPAYMVPQTWAVIKAMPMLVSGKLDRRQVDTWINSLDVESYERITAVEPECELEIEATGTAKMLQQAWVQVLNIPLEKVKLNQSFLSLGGDSITAMAVISRCRKEGVDLSLQDILRCKSILQLTQVAGSLKMVHQYEERIDEPFDLSPIQRLYFMSAAGHQGHARFNQSFSLRISKPAQPDTIKRAIAFVVSQHSMLRARFSRNNNGVWQQRITRNTSSSYRYRTHRLNSLGEIAALAADTQAGLHIERGPVFAVDLFDMKDGEQMIFLAAHHLCVDMVSWRIVLQDLQEFLDGSSLGASSPLPFQIWCSLQMENTREIDPGSLLPFDVYPADLAYWGMVGQPNTYSQVEIEEFTLDRAHTEMALGDCHKALNTEPIDLFLAAIAHSFTRIFADRATPTLYNETHGREAGWNPEIDLSRTVGWFTTIYPLTVPVKLGDEGHDDFIDTLRQTKDIRRRIPENGRPYFAHRFLTDEGLSKSKDIGVLMEIAFNYLGRMQQLERDNSLFQQVELTENHEANKATGDTGPSTARLALFEISAIVLNGKLQVTLMYNRNINRTGDVRNWMIECKRTLEEMVSRLAHTPASPTLSDYPLMPMAYDGLRKLVQDVFPKIGVRHFSQVEDVYPCSPIQQGLLISQIRDPSTYIFHTIFEARHARPGVRLDAHKIGKAWQKVVDRHAALRTIFVDSVYRGGVFDQVVVKNVDSGVKYIRCADRDAITKLNAISIHETAFKKQTQLPHQLTVCTTTSGRVLVKAEINHVVIDGSSISIILDDLTAAYEDTLEDGPGPLYSEYIKFIRSQPPPSSALQFWTTYLKGIQPCHFPTLNRSSTTEKRLSSVKMEFNRFSQLQEFSEKTTVTLANIMHTAWAVVLRKYTGLDDVCFGYLSAGRDAPIKNIQHIVGAFINMLCCRVKVSNCSTLVDLSRTTQEDYLESIPYQRCSLAQVQHGLGLAGKALYNTSLSIQNHSRASDRPEESIVYDVEEAHDPSEYVVTVNIETAKNEEGVVFRYWSHLISEDQAMQLARTFAETLDNFINKSWQTASQLDTPKEQPERKIVTRPRPSRIDTQNSANQKHLTRQLVPNFAETLQNPVQQLMARPITQSIQPQIQQTTQEPIRPPIQQSVLNDSVALKQIVNQCVQQIIEQMFKTGAFVPSTTDVMEDLVSDRPAGPSLGSGPNTPSTNQSRGELGGDQFVEPAPNRRSMAAQITKRGRSAQTEKKLLAIWSSMLDLSVDSINKDDSFFELGGDSITAMRLVGAARDEGLALTVADVFRNPSFEDMAAIIRVASIMSTYLTDTDFEEYNAHKQALHKTSVHDPYERFSLVKATNVDIFLQSKICPKVGVFKGGIADVLPVTDFQSLAITGTLLESRWMLNYFYLDGSGVLDLRQLKQSCFRLVQAFDILRTVFLPSGDRFLQVVLRKLRPEFQAFETEQDLDEFTAMLQKRDQDQGPRLGEPFVQFTVAKQKFSSRHRIFIRISHAQYDGVCFPRIMAALQAGYQGEPISSTPSFANYVRASAGTVTSDHYQHWKTLLKGSSMTEVVHRNGPNYRRSAGATTCLKQKVHLPHILHGNITTASVVKAAWAYVLAQISAHSDVVFGHTISGRNAAVDGVENIIGPCLNLVPVRVQFEPFWVALDLLRHVQDQQVANMPYEALGFREIIKHCTEWPDWTNFTTAIQHQNFSRGSAIQLGHNMYELGAVGTEEDFADFSILSTPLEEPYMFEISLTFSLNGAITTTFAEKAFNMLCTAAGDFSKNPGTSLIPPSELHCLRPQTIGDITIVSDDLFQSTHLHGLSRAEILVISDVVSRAWHQVLRDANDACTPIQLDSSFFELGGDIMGLAQIAWQLEQEGFKVRVEDLIDHPTMLGQMAVLSLHNSRAAAKPADSQPSLIGTPSPPMRALTELEPIPLQRMGRSNTFVKAVSLARRMVKRNTRPTQPVTPA
ncbi:nonribosomal peptide synthase [Glonium stellatum]|uniref:Nonribosomal peptide synthase n=1 Tax=Glonium stellatum TaxID=574774 RepID=A0A8E2FBY9_9PEZI|nr:nonribosomal peptide synthase [Glonium stellatum]